MEDALPRDWSPALDANALDAEWHRLSLLLTLAEAMRGGAAPSADFEPAFADAQQRLSAARDAGVWRELAELCEPDDAARLLTIDIDLLALALAPEARPVLAMRMRALQPDFGTPAPGLALAQEVLMLETGADVALLHSRLAPDAPLVASRLLRVERQGGALVMVPAARVIRRLFNRPADAAPPPGADLIATHRGLEALILPERTARRVEEFLGWILGRGTVFGDWQGRPIGGPIALFSGPSGVGKSFAVACITRELTRRSGAPWQLYRLDLGRIVSKYVGETEKNMNALLDAMAGMRAVLQIDEADGMLGKRGEIRDARDRYANLEVSHLLSRLETHDGPVVLTTNMRSNIDAAFLRRFQAVVDFPAPDPAMRAALWSRLLPPGAPCAADVDPGLLGRALPLSGGAIHNAAINAAMRAAAGARDIGLGDLAIAAWRELGKEARTVRRTELGEMARHLPEDEE